MRRDGHEQIWNFFFFSFKLADIRTQQTEGESDDCKDKNQNNDCSAIYARQCYLQTSTKQTPSRYSDQGCIKYARDDRIFRSKWS